VPENTVKLMDENTRRYYLDVMGIQCWESISPVEQLVEPSKVTESLRDDALSFPLLEEAIRQCDKCQLHEGRRQAISGRGNLSAELMFVILAPDAVDDEAATICSGEANDLLAKMLAAINLSIDDVYISSLLKCAVPATHTVSTTEMHHCGNHLKHQIQLIQPKLLVALGETAARCLLQENLSLDDIRSVTNASTEQKMFEAVTLFTSYSPQELMQQPDNKRKAWLDLQKIQKIIQA
jgi:uracil-DNA glycosylase family 4